MTTSAPCSMRIFGMQKHGCTCSGFRDTKERTETPGQPGKQMEKEMEKRQSAPKITKQDVLDKVIRTKGGLLPNGGEERHIFELGNEGKVVGVKCYGPTGNCYYRYIPAAIQAA